MCCRPRFRWFRQVFRQALSRMCVGSVILATRRLQNRVWTWKIFCVWPSVIYSCHSRLCSTRDYILFILIRDLHLTNLGQSSKVKTWWVSWRHFDQFLMIFRLSKFDVFLIILDHILLHVWSTFCIVFFDHFCDLFYRGFSLVRPCRRACRWTCRQACRQACRNTCFRKETGVSTGPPTGPSTGSYHWDSAMKKIGKMIKKTMQKVLQKWRKMWSKMLPKNIKLLIKNDQEKSSKIDENVVQKFIKNGFWWWPTMPWGCVEKKSGLWEFVVLVLREDSVRFFSFVVVLRRIFCVGLEIQFWGPCLGACRNHRNRGLVERIPVV